MSSSGEHGKRRVRAALLTFAVLLLAGLVLFSPSPPLEAQEPGKDDNPGPRECSEIDDSCYPSVHINNLLSELDSGQSDAFVAGAIDLESTERYRITVSRESGNTDIGFNSTCSTVSESVTVPAGRTSYDLSATLWACGAPGGAVTATLSRQDIIGPHVIYTTVDTESQTVTVNPAPPPAPENVEADATGRTSVSVSWNSQSGISRYRVERRKSGTSRWTTVSSYVTGTSRSVTGLECGASYDFRVSAYGDGTGLCRRVEFPGAGFGQDGPVHTSRAHGRQSRRNGQDQRQRELDSQSGISRYRVERRKSGTSRWTTVSSYVTGTSRSVTGLECGASYDFRVSAYGDGTAFAAEWSSPAQDSARTDLCIPPAPTGVRADATGRTSVSVSWNSQSGISRYWVERRKSGTSRWTTVSSNVAGTSRSVTGLECGASYDFRVSAYGDGTAFAAEWSSPAQDSARTDLCIPPAPTGVRADATGRTSVSVSWNYKSGISRYWVERRKSGTSGWTTVSSNVAGTSRSVTGLECGASYDFRVSAYGDGTAFAAEWSSPAQDSARTDLCIPPAPTGVRADATGRTSVTVNWDPGSGISRYRVERRKSGTSGWTTVSSNVAGTSRSVTGLECGADYDFRVSAYGNGTAFAADWSSTSQDSATTGTCLEPPGAPPSARAWATGQNDIHVRWFRQTGVAKFRVEQLAPPNKETGEGATWVTLDREIDGESYTDGGLNCNTVRIYRVSGYGDGTTYAAEWGPYATYPWVTSDSCSRFNLTPDTLALGGSSEVWPVTSDVTGVYLDVHFSEALSKDDRSRNIKIRHLPPDGTEEETYEVADEAHSRPLRSVARGSRISIDVDADAFDQQAALVSLSFHPGSEATSGAIARASVQKEARPPQPLPGVPPAVVDEDNETVTLDWVEGADVPNDNPHHYLVAFYDSLRTVVYSETVDYSSPDATTLDIDQAWDRLGAGTHTAEVSLCNAAGGCSLPLLITFTLPFRFTPSPLALGETSDNVWTVPPEVTSVYLQVAFSAGATGAIGPGDINIQRVGAGGTVLSTHAVDGEGDSGVLSGVTAGSRVRIDVDSDAYDAQAALVTLTFHSGSGASGNEIANATVQTGAEPPPPPVFQFMPSPLALGETSANVWTVPQNVTGVYLQAAFSPEAIDAIAPGKINILSSTGSVSSTHEVDDRNGDGILNGVTAGSLVRIAVDNDAFQGQAADVTLTFRSGAANGPVIARGSVDTQAQPSAPTSGTATPDRAGDTVTLGWSAGPPVSGARPHNYKVVVQGSTISRTTNRTSLVIANSRSVPGQGRQTAGVRHCNAAGGCSDPLNIGFTVLPPPEEVRISGLNSSIGVGGPYAFSVQVSNMVPAWTYSITVRVNNSNVGFNMGCTDLSESAPDFTGGGTHTASLGDLYACSAGSARVTATITAGTTSVTSYQDVTVTAALPAIPTDLTGIAGDGEITLDWDDIPGADGYVVQQLRAVGGSGFEDLPFGPYTISFSGSSATIEGLTNARSYSHRVRSRNSAGESASSSHIVTTLPLAAPTGLDVTPMPLREARLTWTESSNNPSGSSFEVEIQAQGGTWIAPRIIPVAATSSGDRSFWDIELDAIMGAPPNLVGLGHAPYAYEMRVKVIGSSGNSGYSETVTIIGNPVISANGYSPNAGSNQGKAKIIWPRIAGTTGLYTIRYRRLLEYDEKPHAVTGWKPENYEVPARTYGARDSNPSGTAGTRLTDTIAGLILREIYAIQLNYQTSTGQKVFSARDAFVWPSDDFPYGGTRVATYPFFGHWPEGRYSYTICDSTFPESTRSQWNSLIKHAFKQWEIEIANGKSIETNARTRPCPERDSLIGIVTAILGNKLVTFLSFAVKSELIDVYMVDTGTVADDVVAGFTEFMDNPLGLCVFLEAACVYSSVQYLVPLAQAGTKLGDEGFLNAGVHVLINKERVEEGDRQLDIPGGNTTFHEDDVRFNTCREFPGNPDFRNYELMVHEAGHALGLSGFRLGHITFAETPHAERHPSIAGSVLNDPEDEEPDCSPHPMDKLAIFALYQSVLR